MKQLLGMTVLTDPTMPSNEIHFYGQRRGKAELLMRFALQHPGRVAIVGRDGTEILEPIQDFTHQGGPMDHEARAARVKAAGPELEAKVTGLMRTGGARKMVPAETLEECRLFIADVNVLVAATEPDIEDDEGDAEPPSGDADVTGDAQDTPSEEEGAADPADLDADTPPAEGDDAATDPVEASEPEPPGAGE